MLRIPHLEPVLMTSPIGVVAGYVTSQEGPNLGISYDSILYSENKEIIEKKRTISFWDSSGGVKYNRNNFEEIRIISPEEFTESNISLGDLLMMTCEQFSVIGFISSIKDDKVKLVHEDPFRCSKPLDSKEYYYTRFEKTFIHEF